MAKEILTIFKKIDNPIFYISFHTNQSVQAWYELLSLINNRSEGFVFMGQVIEHNKEEAHEWLKNWNRESKEPSKHKAHYFTFFCGKCKRQKH